MTNREKLQRMRDSMATGTPDMPAVLATLIEIVQEREPAAPSDTTYGPSKIDQLHGAAVCEIGLLLHGDLAKVDRGAAEVRLHAALNELAAHVSGARGAALQPGDVVRLRSGGPAMTVLGPASTSINASEAMSTPEDWLLCQYYWEATRASRRESYPAAALRKVEDEQALELKARRAQLGEAYELIERGYEAIVEVERYLVASPSALSKEMLTEKIGGAREALFGALAEDA